MRELPPSPVSQSVWNSLTEAEKEAVVKRDFPNQYPSGYAYGLGKDPLFALTSNGLTRIYAFDSY